MEVVVVGLNYQTAPVEVREKVSLSQDLIPAAMLDLKERKSVYENILISTCNRTEIYAVVDLVDAGVYNITQFIAERFGLDASLVRPFLYVHEGSAAIRHLLRVTCGLDSMVLGETQILGQIKASFQIGQKDKTIGVLFNHLLKQAVTFAKRAHTETEINTNAVSISYAAVELAKGVLGSLTDKKVLVFGTGEMGQLAIENLHGNGVKDITVINRTFEKAKKLADKFSGTARRISELRLVLHEADILISSTGAKGYVITEELIRSVMHMRKHQPLLIVDIAVPRDVEPEAANISAVHAYDIDDLEGIVNANLAERKVAAAQIEEMIDIEIDKFNEWYSRLSVVPIIGALKNKADKIQTDTMSSLERKLPELDEREWKVINKHVKSIVNQMLKDPILFVKDADSKFMSKHTMNAVVKIFNIEEEVAEQKLARARAGSRF